MSKSMEPDETEAKVSSFRDVSLCNSFSVSLCSSSNLSDTSFAGSESNDASDASCKGSFPAKPHKGNDSKWNAVQCINGIGLGNFRLLKKLGCGDIGNVYLAELRDTRCLFAMKVMDKGMLSARKKLSRAETEREILGLLDHPFLPTLYSHFETDKLSCLLMEFCSGGDLHTLRQRQPGKSFPEHAARFYISEVLLALEYLHMMGVVYRDLKPENVLVREDGHIMLSDFDLSLRCSVNPTLVDGSLGQASPNRIQIQTACVDPDCRIPVCVQPSCFTPRFLASKKISKGEKSKPVATEPRPVLIAEPTTARSMSFVGTHEYLAPEIIRGDGHGSSVDWWTLGIFLYELLFGRTPFRGTGNRETLFNVVGQPLRFPEGTEVSFEAKDLIRGLLIKEPSKRLGFKRGAIEIKQQPFFDSINWALVRSTPPPEIPKPYNFVPLPSNDGGRMDSSRSSGHYLDFDFF